VAEQHLDDDAEEMSPPIPVEEAPRKNRKSAFVIDTSAIQRLVKAPDLFEDNNELSILDRMSGYTITPTTILTLDCNDEEKNQSSDDSDSDSDYDSEDSESKSSDSDISEHDTDDEKEVAQGQLEDNDEEEPCQINQAACDHEADQIDSVLLKVKPSQLGSYMLKSNACGDCTLSFSFKLGRVQLRIKHKTIHVQEGISGQKQPKISLAITFQSTMLDTTQIKLVKSNFQLSLLFSASSSLKSNITGSECSQNFADICDMFFERITNHSSSNDPTSPIDGGWLVTLLNPNGVFQKATRLEYLTNHLTNHTLLLKESLVTVENADEEAQTAIKIAIELQCRRRDARPRHKSIPYGDGSVRPIDQDGNTEKLNTITKKYILGCLTVWTEAAADDVVIKMSI
jgi:hypothetical protein